MKFVSSISIGVSKLIHTACVSIFALSVFAPTPVMAETVRKIRVNAMSGYSTLNFNVDGAKVSSGSNLIGKVQASYLLGKKGLDLSSTTYMSLKTLSSSSGDDIRSINSNLSISYTPGFFKGSWKATFGLGLNYATITSSSDSFGFRNVIGPSASIRIAKGVRKKDTLTSFAKMTGVLANFRVLSISESRELAFGAAYRLGIGSRYSLSLNGEYFSQSVSFGGSQVSSSSVIFGLGFGF